MKESRIDRKKRSHLPPTPDAEELEHRCPKCGFTCYCYDALGGTRDDCTHCEYLEEQP